MDFTIVHPDFKTQLLVLRAPGYFGSPSVWLNGMQVKRQDGVLTVLNDIGLEVNITLRSSPFDRLPQLLIDDSDIRLGFVPGWSQFAGWQRSLLLRWVPLARQLFRSALQTVRSRAPGKSMQG